ncbi:hypothetical protein ACGFS9_03020 [Streptomyces sp. NPDC048566]|uniref:hypothetical protein n=1 Tax=Streptomyces sp. NPDC048566 TaxID=3365569 RepID=UPI003710D42C
MNTRTITAVTLASLALASLTACESEEKNAVDSKSQPPSISASDKAKAREAAGLPPEPTAATRAAFLDALNAIDSRIIKPGKEDQAVDRGINQCSSIKATPDDTDKLAQLALDRFTVTTRLPDISNPATGTKIVEAVHKHLCPDF